MNQDQGSLSAPASPRFAAILPEITAGVRSAGAFRLAAGVALLGGLLWAFWPTMAGVAQRWLSDPQYSHGYLVPVFALVLLWLRRQHLAGCALRFSWWGLALLAAGLGMYLAGVYFYYDWLAQGALLPCLVGVCVILGGWGALRWSWPAIGFLAFMLPLPHRLEIALSHPLRRICTLASAYIMQTVGLPAVAEGNVIIVNDLRIGVVEACSGLSMLVVFFAISAAVVLVIQRPLLDKILLVASAAPIAIVANVIRITATGILHEIAGSEVADAFFHDLAGWLMMPLAVGFLWLELWFLAHLLVEAAPAPAKPVPLVKPPPFPHLSRKGPKKHNKATRR